MGFRTVVVLNNDLAHVWQKDEQLGDKIWHAASVKSCSPRGASRGFQYGEVVEQVHADAQSIAFLDGYGGEVKAMTHWHRGQTPADKNLEMLKALASELGYTVSKKRATKA